jgi:hypothetical protein
MWLRIVSVKSTTLISLKEHFPFCWMMHPLEFARACSFNTGVLPRVRRQVSNWLNNDFRDTRIGWTPCSHDFNHLIISLFSEVHDRDDLINQILVAATDITGEPRQLVVVIDSIRRRCEVCVRAELGDFEQLLWYADPCASPNYTISDLCKK